MDLFSEIIVSYDISNNKARKKLYDSLLDLGLLPIQKSVFWGRVLDAELKSIIDLFPMYVNSENDDSVFLTKTNLRKHWNKHSIGIPKDVFQHNEHYEII